jgi:ribosome-binding factor A
LAREIAREVAVILQHEISDPRMGFVSVTQAKLSKDLKHARIFVSVLGDAVKKRLSLKGLKHAQGFIRGTLAHRLKIRECPTVEFSLDDTIDKTFAITKILDETAAQRGEEE